MKTQPADLWSLALDRPHVDPNDLAAALVQQVQEDGLMDYRTRHLIHDSLAALQTFWGKPRAERWIEQSPVETQLRTIQSQVFEDTGFPSLRRRLMEKTRPERVRQFFEMLGRDLREPLRIYIGGSIALIVPGYLSRRTEDIDIVGEVPQVFRENYPLMERLQSMFVLHLGHVQPHYYPRNYESRAHSLDSFGRLQVFLLDVYDIILSKLFSVRLKDMEDMMVLLPQLDKEILTRKLLTDADVFLTAPRLLEIATDNWKVLFGEALPT